MRRSKFSESQRMSIIAEQDVGKSVEKICRKHQISPAILYKWKGAIQNGARRHFELHPLSSLALILCTIIAANVKKKKKLQA